jgi:hypothetical protein
MKLLYGIVILLLIGCSSSNFTNKKPKLLISKIIDIKEYEYVFGLKGINQKNDTVLILSYKDRFREKYNQKKIKYDKLQKIVKNGSYNFKVLNIKPQVSTMQQLGAFIIVENDTLCMQADYNKIPTIYVAQNTIGLNIVLN